MYAHSQKVCMMLTLGKPSMAEEGLPSWIVHGYIVSAPLFSFPYNQVVFSLLGLKGSHPVTSINYYHT